MRQQHPSPQHLLRRGFEEKRDHLGRGKGGGFALGVDVVHPTDPHLDAAVGCGVVGVRACHDEAASHQLVLVIEDWAFHFHRGKPHIVWCHEGLTHDVQQGSQVGRGVDQGQQLVPILARARGGVRQDAGVVNGHREELGDGTCTIHEPGADLIMTKRKRPAAARETQDDCDELNGAQYVAALFLGSGGGGSGCSHV